MTNAALKDAGEIVAVPGAGDAEILGVVSWWRLEGPTGVPELQAALQACGVAAKHLPEGPSPALALGRAVGDQENKTTIIRAIGRGNWAVLKAQTGDNVVTTQQAVRAYIEDDALRFEPCFGDAIELAIANDYSRHLAELDHRDVSRWASEYLHGPLQAVALRDTGGIYFVPRSAVKEWREITAAVESFTKHRFFELPAVGAQKTIDGVLAAIEQDAEVAAEQMELELDVGALGKRGLNGRVERCGEILAKIETYETLLGTGLEKLRERVNGLKAAFAAAAIAKMAEGEEVK